MTRLLPRTMAGQLILVLLAVIVAAHLLTFLIFAGERRSALEIARREQVAEQLIPIVRLVLTVPPEEREALLRPWREGPLSLSVDKDSIVDVDDDHHVHRLEEQMLRRLERRVRTIRVELDDDVPIWSPRQRWGGGPPGRGYALLVAVGLPDQGWLNARLAVRPPIVGFAGPYLVILGLTLIGIVLTLAVGVRRLTRPIRALADATDKMGRGERVEPLPITGPSEIRRATVAFNAMGERLDRYVSDRLRMLAAISHDLRTPITSLRLRTELIDDAETREKMLETLQEMQRMVEATLAFAREEAESEPTRTVDLQALADSIVQDLADLGQPATILERPALPLACRPMALRRAIRNLVENAIRYGKLALVTVEIEGSEAVLRVDDDGPGIPAERLDDVFEPFVRLDESRSEATGGVGLGLSIARSIVHAHGGQLLLINRPEGGLRAELRLPRA